MSSVLAQSQRRALCLSHRQGSKTNKNMLSIFKYVAASLLVMLSMGAQAEQLLSIEITANEASAVPIAVVPFAYKGSGSPKEDIAGIVQADLARSGVFNPLDRNRMLSRPSQPSDIVLRDWRVLDTDYVVVGQVAGSPQQAQIDFALVEVQTGKTVRTKSSRFSGSDWRSLAHAVSDNIYEAITGFKGVFSTEVLYISQVQNQSGRMYELQKADADGYGAQTILRSREPIMSPAWAPDGKHIAYVSYESSRPAIYVQNVLTGSKRQVTRYRGINGAPDWSPDGRYLTMTLSKDGNPEIYVLELQTGRLTRLTRHFAIDTEPRWAPNGKDIIFTSDRGGNPQIYQINVASKQLKRLTYEGDYNARGMLTADGQHLVMVHKVNGSFNVAVQDLKYGEVRILTKTRLDESPTVAPNGQQIMFATQEGNRGLLSIVSMDGRTRIRLPSRVGEVREPSWSPFLR